MNLTIKIKKIFLPKCLWDRHAKGIKMDYELSEEAFNATYNRAITIQIIRLKRVLGDKDISCQKGFKKVTYDATTGLFSYHHESKYVGQFIEKAVINLRHNWVIESTSHLEYPHLIKTVQSLIKNAA